MNENELVGLEPLDPGWDDPGYWEGFRRTVLDRARGELARRRELVRLTVPGVLSSWSRGLMPVALAAAAIAAFMIVSERRVEPEPVPLALEDILSEETRGGPFASVMDGTTEWAPAAFMTLVEEEVP